MHQLISGLWIAMCLHGERVAGRLSNIPLPANVIVPCACRCPRSCSHKDRI